MLEVTIPGRGARGYSHLVSDFNGTLALDGELLPGVAGRLRALSGVLGIHVITADTFGRAAGSLEGLPLTLTVLDAREGGEAKAAAVEELGEERVIAAGNGSNDAAMLAKAALGIVINGPEGCARDALISADVVVPGIGVALDLLLRPERLVATLRR